MPVVLRLYPVPFEALDSLLDRVWAANYDAVLPWGWRRGLPVSAGPAVLWDEAGNLDAVSAFTGLAPRTLLAGTVHRFARRCLWPEDLTAGPELHGRPVWEAVDRALYVGAADRLCPLCWRERGVRLVPWRLRFITTCPVHRVLLVDHCAGCGAPLRLEHTPATCGACGRDLATLEARSIAAHAPSLSLTTLLWSAIGCGVPFPPQGLPLPTTHPLRRLHPATLLLFLWVTALGVPPLRTTDPLAAPDPDVPWLRVWTVWSSGWLWPLGALTRPPRGVEPTHAALLHVWRQILQEPDVQQELLAWEAETTAIRRLRARLRTRTGDVQAAREPTWGWLQEQAIPGGMWARLRDEACVYQRTREQALGRPPIDLWQHPALPLADAVRQLRVGCYALRCCARDPDADPPSGETRPSRLGLLWAGDERVVLAGKQLTLAEVAERCGLPAREVIALIAAGFLEAEQGPLVDGAPAYRVTGTALYRLFDCVSPRATPPRNEQLILLTLASVLRQLAAAAIRASQALAAIMAGDLPIYCGTFDGPLVSTWVPHHAVAAYRRHLAWQARQPLASAADVCRCLGCSPHALRTLYREAILVPAIDETDERGVDWRYVLGGLDHILWRYVTLREAAGLLWVTPTTMRALIATRQLTPLVNPPVDGSRRYRLDRFEIYRLRDRRQPGSAMLDAYL